MLIKTPTLRDLALDHIHAIAAQLRKADPTLSREQAVAKAARTPEGREAHRIYNTPGSHLAWPQALDQISKAGPPGTNQYGPPGTHAQPNATPPANSGTKIGDHVVVNGKMMSVTGKNPDGRVKVSGHPAVGRTPDHHQRASRHATDSDCARRGRSNRRAGDWRSLHLYGLD